MGELYKFDTLARKLHGGPRPPDNQDMEGRLTKLEAIIPTLATKADVEGVRTDIQKGINETHKWMLGTVVGLFLGFGGLFLAMSNSLKPATGTSGNAQAPIIINIPTPVGPVPLHPTPNYSSPLAPRPTEPSSATK